MRTLSVKERELSVKTNNRGQVLLERLEKYKMVAAIKDIKNIERAIKYKENLSAVLLMTGSILTVKRYVDHIQSEGLPVILHVDKIGGLEMDHDGIDFINKSVRPFAIVTTKSGVIKRAKSSGILVIQRIFLIDTDVYMNLVKDVSQIRSDIIEVMPSRAPDFINKLTKVLPVPIITGGLLNLPQHAREALDNGALAITTSNSELWKIDMNGV
ncbi:glycerol-3-phosphate responsive antiterminator [Rummeliibacillus sp. NPDC094406]|uniref:glycerol-3-phosphate responsive antiterminator n=1 Tax=Rummeliibacillus sp. NPDC094406 TaxID=3364511 RepID=UPI00380F742B